jgi:hypothetical protein
VTQIKEKSGTHLSTDAPMFTAKLPDEFSSISSTLTAVPCMSIHRQGSHVVVSVQILGSSWLMMGAAKVKYPEELGARNFVKSKRDQTCITYSFSTASLSRSTFFFPDYPPEHLLDSTALTCDYGKSHLGMGRVFFEKLILTIQ